MTCDEETIVNSLRALHDLSKAVNSTLNINLVEDMLLHKTSQLMKSPKVLILLLNDKTKSLNIHNALGFEPYELMVHKFENIQPFDHCIVHKGSVITIDEVLSPADTEVRKICPQLFEMFFAPLEIRGRAYGLLGVMGSKEKFSRIDLEIFCSIGSQAAVAMENAGLYEKLHSTFLHTAEALAEAISSRDPYTGGHTRRVRTYALQLAEKLGLDSEEKNALRLAAILHDVGKIGIDDAILRKVERLTAEEKRKMSNHPRIGARILGYVEEMKAVIPGVLHHHEWFNGKGYPDGLVAEQIPLQARIIAIADAFDALTTDRPYRRASMANEALDILAGESGIHFDPELLRIFRRLQTAVHS
ncbi:HD domain-containing phosphohydrolase [Desulfobacterota bacterium M19]